MRDHQPQSVQKILNPFVSWVALATAQDSLLPG
jgi:hypothetical protein